MEYWNNRIETKNNKRVGKKNVLFPSEKGVMLNLFQHLIESSSHETLN
jgi:hypothetical protein